jgi:hypothetical protein
MDEKFSAYGQLVLTEASSSFYDLALNPNDVPATPNGFDYVSISDMGDYSDLRMKWWYLEGGISHNIGAHTVFEYALTYDDYDDGEPYLADTSGKKLGLLFRANWLF